MSAGPDRASIWAVVLLAGAGTIALKSSFVVLFGRVEEMPDRLERLLGLVAPAVLAALVAPALVTVSPDPTPRLVFEPAKPVAGALAAVVAWRTGNVLATLVVGMVALWTVQALV